MDLGQQVQLAIASAQHNVRRFQDAVDTHLEPFRSSVSRQLTDWATNGPLRGLNALNNQAWRPMTAVRAQCGRGEGRGSGRSPAGPGAWTVPLT
jgi:hypothetical protein